MPTYMSEEALSERATILFTHSQRRWLEAKARKEGRSMNQTIRMLINEMMAATQSPEKANGQRAGRA